MFISRYCTTHYMKKTFTTLSSHLANCGNATCWRVACLDTPAVWPVVSASNLTTSRSQLPPAALRTRLVQQPLKPSSAAPSPVSATASFGVLACFPSLSLPPSPCFSAPAALPFPIAPLPSSSLGHFCGASLNVVSSLVGSRLTSSSCVH